MGHKPLDEVLAGLTAVRERTHAAGMLGQGLLEHQRQLEGMLEDLEQSDTPELQEHVLAELHEIQQHAEALFGDVSSAFGHKAEAPVSLFAVPNEPDTEHTRLEGERHDAVEQLATVRSQLNSLQGAMDASRQENWDLHVARQQLEEELASRASACNRAETERTRLGSELARLRESYEQQRQQSEEVDEKLKKITRQREMEQASTRRERAGFQRNVSNLQSELRRIQAREQAPPRPSTPQVEVHEDEEEGEFPADASHASILDSPVVRRRLHFGGNDVYSAGSLESNAEIDELRTKLSVAIKRLGRDNQTQRRLREQVAEMRRQLGRAQSDDDDDEDDEELAWITEPDNRASHTRVPRRRAHVPRSASHLSIAAPAQEWVDEGDESVIIKDEPLDPSMAGLLSTTGGAPFPRSSSGAHIARSASSTSNDAPATLGAELVAHGYTAPSSADEAKHAEELRALREEMSAAHAADVARLNEEHEKQRQSLIAAADETKAALEKKHTAEMAARNKKHEADKAAALDKLRKELENKHNAEVNKRT